MVCPVCRRQRCREVWLEGLLAPGPEAIVSDWESTEHVWGTDELGRKVLVYAPGDAIPAEEARRQGLLGAKARQAPPETKHVESPPETKSTSAGPPTRSDRRRRT